MLSGDEPHQAEITFGPGDDHMEVMLDGRAIDLKSTMASIIVRKALQVADGDVHIAIYHPPVALGAVALAE